MKSVDWYFDFVSPFSHIALYRLHEIPARIVLKPVLFAGLLAQWGQKGPAEIPGKRQWTYRWCTWWAGQLGVPFRFPAAHPFNPLPYLRLVLVAGPTRENVGRIFDALWTRGGDAGDPQRVAARCAHMWVPRNARLGFHSPSGLCAEDLERRERDGHADCPIRDVQGQATAVGLTVNLTADAAA